MKLDTSTKPNKQAWEIIQNRDSAKPRNDMSSVFFGGTPLTDYGDIAEAFSAHFSAVVVTPIADNLAPAPDAVSLFTGSISESFFVAPSTPREVARVIDSLRTKTSKDVHGLDVGSLKKVKYCIAGPLSVLFNEPISVLLEERRNYPSLQKGGKERHGQLPSYLCCFGFLEKVRKVDV